MDKKIVERAITGLNLVFGNCLLRALTITLILLNSGVSPALADPVRSIQELRLLPKYCRGTLLIREISHDKTPIATYEKIYGPTFTHLHHYCWALNSMNNVAREKDDFLRKSNLRYAIGDINYVIERADQKFILLPEIYATRASILALLKDYPHAIASLHAAIKLKPTYVRGYAQMSDFFLAIGNRADAIKVLKVGYAKTGGAPPIAKRLAKLGQKP